MKQIATQTDINMDDRKISNHSGRKTLVQILKRLNVSNAECMASSRHKSEQGLARYERLESEMQHNNSIKLAQSFGFKVPDNSEASMHCILVFNISLNNILL
jgi:hypothetical protein